MRRALQTALWLLLVAAACACTRIPPDPLQIDHGVLTVNNQSGSDWNGVEIWINRYFRVTVPTIAAGGRFQVPLDAFVSGYSQRFDSHHVQISDLRLTATQADGVAVALKMEHRSGLAALGGKH